jgi:acetyl esterase/lipase
LGVPAALDKRQKPQGGQGMSEIQMIRDMLAGPDAPKQGPLENWVARRQMMDQNGLLNPLPEGWSAAPTMLGGLKAEHHTSQAARQDGAMLYLHGGGYTLGSPVSYRGVVSQIAAAANVQTYAPDYRLAPEHPFPAAIDDAHEAFLALLATGIEAERIVVAGDSAGGGLALALAVRLRDEGRALPSALFLISPWGDLTLSGRSYIHRAEADPLLSKPHMQAFQAAYLAGQSPTHPYASPALADLSGLPPILIQVGTDDILLSDSEMIQERAQAAGTFASLEVWPNMIHTFHVFYPFLTPARDAIEDAGGWLKRRWAQG